MLAAKRRRSKIIAADELLPGPPGTQIPYGNLPYQYGELKTPGDSVARPPLVMIVHGGFWRSHQDLRYLRHMADALAERGVASWNVEFRRVGSTGGGWPQTLLDVGAAADFIPMLARRYGLDAKRAGVVGHSAGGHLALWLGGRRGIAASSVLHSATPFDFRHLWCVGGVPDLETAWHRDLGDGAVSEFIGGTPVTHPDRYGTSSPRSLLPLGTPTTLVHGELDDAVPIELAYQFADLAIRAGDDCKVIGLRNVGHFEAVLPHTPAGEALTREIAFTLTGELAHQPA